MTVGLATSLLASPVIYAEGLTTTLRLPPELLHVEVKKDGQDELQEARLKSDLGFQFNNELFQFAIDYKAQIQLKDEVSEADFSQHVNTSVYSSALNRILGFNADLRTESAIRHGSDAYRYSVTPGFSRSFSDLATLSLQYQYLADKAHAKALRKEKTGYLMELSGKAHEGRLTWRGNYRSSEESDGAWQLQSMEILEFESRIHLVPDLRLVLSGRSKDEVIFDAGLKQNILKETRYGVGLAWSPSQHYSMAFKLNKRNESQLGQGEVFGSGTMSWFPRNDTEFTLSYGDHLVEGARALMLQTRIDLNGS